MTAKRATDLSVVSGAPGDKPRHERLADAYEQYLLHCSDYLKRQMMIYEHWPQRKYDVLGYRDEKVFADMNN